ncbi:hypothetical protein BGZ60DRAFT_550664 [Tricladium varicosporioides]|nr:hypothetical protein BGZ60DRAFT_550664 [Hymenoscyphus varicosporioides]
MGGIKVIALSEGLSHAPYYRVPTLKPLFDASSDKTSQYARLIEVTSYIIGRTVDVKFRYTCGDAARQNIVTIAIHRACQDFLDSISSKDLGIVDFQIEGQFSFDKKLS